MKNLLGLVRDVINKSILILLISGGCLFFILLLFMENITLVNKDVQIVLSRSEIMQFWLTWTLATVILGIPVFLLRSASFSPIRSRQQTEGIGYAAIKKSTNHADDMDEEIKALHESGHVIMALVKTDYDFKVINEPLSIYVQYTSAKVTRAEDLYKMILTDYAGAAAEEIVYGKISSGSMGTPTSDFERAKERIKMYITMTEDVSKALLDSELSDKIINASNLFYAEAKDILSDHLEELKKLSEKLKGVDSMTRKEIEQLLFVR